MVEPLTPTRQRDAPWAAALPPPTAALTLRIVEDVHLLSLRHFGEAGAAAVEAALAAQGLSALPRPGECVGADPSWQVWIGPSECLLLTSHRAVAEGLLRALQPGREGLACAIDQSAATLVIELLGDGAAALLSRLLDASAIPQHGGQGGRARWVDIAAVVVCLQPERYLLMVDRAQGGYVAEWLGYAAAASFGPVRAGR